jgi:pantothenate kinase
MSEKKLGTCHIAVHGKETKEVRKYDMEILCAGDMSYFSIKIPAELVVALAMDSREQMGPLLTNAGEALMDFVKDTDDRIKIRDGAKG